MMLKNIIMGYKMININHFSIYLLSFIVFPILIFYKFKVVNVNDEFLNRRNTNIIKGICILVIMLHHISQSVINPQLMKAYQNIGYLGVSIFLLYSGYGLTISKNNKKTLVNLLYLKD